ncbi:hypothetical protein JC606_00335 [Vibrio sp. IB15]|uniref:helix-turn-helix domain-containing protein n=1 Tax=Vibrio TaxID=662 RepID=UPI000975779D|nr:MULTISPECIES: helix-turn-helix domain-containing protein [Vibrio]MBJ2144835.1 hypothetical protein [Vibrio sp. IB15]OMO22338.1 hypothetical protein BH583_09180 [Vibrio lentus]PMH89815.1 hypothetical protein BCU56_19080 [Vibrio lentus]PMI95252.1 hypothetical protein BCU33_11145 [Vibrio lentus]PMK84185.1 hypothetical protein BCT90_01480 [Vibrio lentus]
MITTLDLLNRLRVEKQLVSDRQVAKYLELHHSTVNKWRNGGTMSEEHACEVADLLGLDVDFVLLANIAERSKSDRVINAVERALQDKKIA